MMFFRVISTVQLSVVAWLSICLGVGAAQAAEATSVPVAGGASSRPVERVELNFPENLELKVLINYVGKRQGINFIYDEQVGNKTVTIKAPQQVPQDSLMSLLESALAMKGLSMVRTDVPGMVRIEAAKALTAVAPLATATGESEETSPLAMTRIFELKYANPQQVDLIVKPFLSASTANLTVLPEHDLVIVTDYASNMKRVADLIALIDRPRRDVEVRFVPVKNLEAVAMAQKVTQLLAGKAKARSGSAKDAASDVTVLGDERTNQVAVVGMAQPVAEAVTLIESLDVPLGLETRTYTLTSVSPERIDRMVKELLGEATAKRLYRSAMDRESNILVVTTTAEIHQQVETIRKTLDKPTEEGQSPIRFYKLENAKALDVLATLQSIEGDEGLDDVSVDGMSGESRPKSFGDENKLIMTGPTEEQVNRPESQSGKTGALGSSKAKVSRIETRGGTRVMADEASNMIIVVAKPAMQAVYEKLIKRLDTRRPQVLVEATVVMIDTTNDFSLGIEIAQNRSFDNGQGRILTFSSFGLSTVDGTSGSLTLTPGTGFNGALISSDIADIIIRALASDSRSKVVSRPSVLINDNAKGTLVSENEEPYSSVNASSTVATTSFAGYSSAGTNIIVKPQISEGEHLKLEYEITLSSFGTVKEDSQLPPSRQRNTLTSEVTIPDGYTIIVGGLTRETSSKTVDRIPGLGQLPVIEYLFSSRSIESHKSTMFVFLRAVILRDDKFKDLKSLSRESALHAELSDDFPASEPVVIR